MILGGKKPSLVVVELQLTPTKHVREKERTNKFRLDVQLHSFEERTSFKFEEKLSDREIKPLIDLYRSTWEYTKATGSQYDN